MIMTKLWTENFCLKDEVKNMKGKKEKEYFCKECGEKLEASINKGSDIILISNCKQCEYNLREDIISDIEDDIKEEYFNKTIEVVLEKIESINSHSIE